MSTDLFFFDGPSTLALAEPEGAPFPGLCLWLDESYHSSSSSVVSLSRLPPRPPPSGLATFLLVSFLAGVARLVFAPVRVRLPDVVGGR